MLRPLSIGFINNFGGPALGGGEVQLLELVRGLLGHGARVTVVCSRGSALESALGELSGVIVVPETFDARSLRAVAARLHASLADCAIVQGTGFLTNVIARRVGKHSGAAVINTVHVVPGAARLDGEGAVSSAARWLLDRSLRSRVDRFVAVSGAVGRALGVQGIDAHRIAVIHNGIDIARLRESVARTPGMDVPPGSPRIGYVGRLERVKGCEYFLRAASGVLEQQPEARFVVAGTGSLAGALAELARSLGIHERVTFAGHLAEPASLIAALDAVVVPSLSEASGLTAIEALALGTPVVATNVGGVPEVVVDGECGLLVPAANADALRNAMLRVTSDAELAERFRVAGRAHVEQHFSAERMVAQYVELYRELIA